MWHPVVGSELARQRRERLLGEARHLGRGPGRGPGSVLRQLVGFGLVAAGNRILGRALEAR